MSISQSRYVNITSGVGGQAAVPARELIGRLFADNPLIPTNAVVEFTTADAVGAYFGTGSPEYLRAVFYFGFVSKLIGSPKKISYGRYAKATAVARLYGGVSNASLATFTAINAGTLTLTVGGQVAALVGVDLSGAASFAAVAALVQAAIRGAAGSQFAAALVTYDAPSKKFTFAASVLGAATIITPTGTIAGPLGWTASDAILSPGAAVQTLDAAVAASVGISNNFGSFAVVPATTTGEIVTAATWNATQGVSYMFCAAVTTEADAETVYAALLAVEGTAVTYAPTVGEYDEMCPMMLMAATDYTRRGAAQNYMFTQFALTAKVTTDSLADQLDAHRCNYYGQTQESGTAIDFYQRGTMMGGVTAPVDQNVYANECWLRDAAASAILTGLLALPQIPANSTGRGIVIGLLAASPAIDGSGGGPVQQGLRNGTISTGKTLTTAQQLYVTDLTGDVNAWRQVQSIGYWLDCVIAPYVTGDGRTEYKAEYTLVYSKDDTIRKVDGAHVLV